MSENFKIIACFAFFALFQFSANAQFFVIYDIGLSEYDVEIENFGDNHYGTITPTFLNLGVQYNKGSSRWNFNVSSQNTQLNPVIEEIDYFEGTHTIDHTRLNFNFEYLRKVHEFSNGITAFLGLDYIARQSSYSNRIQSEFMERNWDFEESVILDLSILGAAEYRFDNKLLSMKMGAGVFNYRFVTERHWSEENEFYGTGPNLLVQFQNEIYIQIPITNTISIKPEYSFKYYKYRYYSEMRALQQHFLIGGVFQL